MTTIFSLEPIWIHYGTFPHLPQESEDIYCDQLNFEFGLGYSLLKKLAQKTVPTEYVAQIREEVFLDILRTQAHKDQVEENLVFHEPVFQTEFQINAAVKGQPTQWILAKSDEANSAFKPGNYFEHSSLAVCVNWRSQPERQKLLDFCKEKNLPLILAFPLDADTAAQSELLKVQLNRYACIKLCWFYRTSYPVEKSLTTQLSTSLGNEIAPTTIFETPESIQISDFVKLPGSASKDLHTFPAGEDSRQKLLNALSTYIPTIDQAVPAVQQLSALYRQEM